MSTRWSARSDILAGFACLALLVAGFGSWSVSANVAGGIIAGGRVETEGSRHIVQHPDGGEVLAVHVVEGTMVTEGQMLISLDPAPLASELAIIEGQLFDILARRARLEAERDDRAAPVFHPDLARRPELAPLRALQIRLLAARRSTRDGALAQLNKRQAQIGAQIAGLSAQRAALEAQAGLIAEEAADQQILRDKGLTQAARLLALRREAARLDGALGDVTAQIAGTEGRRTELDLERLRLDAAQREEAITALEALYPREQDLIERRAALRTRLDRLAIRAPVTGRVHGLEITAPHAVLLPAKPALSIIPSEGSLDVSARVRVGDIDLVHAGQAVTLRFPALGGAATPELPGRVAHVSADTFTEDITGRSYYSARVTLARDHQAQLEGTMLLPGMPVEVLFRTGDRTPLSLLVKPLGDYFARALRG